MNRKTTFTTMKTLAVFISLVFFVACDKESNLITQEQPVIKDSVIANPDRFITFDYIELDKIERISKFRSGIGHDYRDDAESCRSMKHYFQPKSKIAWSSVKIFSPVSGIITRTFDEWAGTQVQIRPFSHSSFTVIIFHVALLQPMSVGDSVVAGAQIGTHIGSQTMSDIAVGYASGNSWRLFSYFDMMTDSLFKEYIDRGVPSRSAMIISKSERDTDPLNCSGETFGSSGSLSNWTSLN